TAERAALFRAGSGTLFSCHNKAARIGAVAHIGHASWRHMGPGAERILRLAVAAVYSRCRLTFVVLLAFTAAMLVQALRLQPDAGYEKQIPLQHEYMQVFKQYEKAFGGANLVTVAMINRDGDIYNEAFLENLRKATDEVFFLP